MKYLSVCSGIEAATVAWHHMGWQAAGFSEIEKFPSQVLAHHYPNVPNLGDMTNYKEWDIGTIDLLVGGTPCQSFSVAGLRKGLEDPRGNLALVYCGILDHFRPKWFVWENVPGVLSSNGGRDFGSFLGAVAQLGYGFSYRVLDAQFFGVAQRRRRVFVVGHLGDWRPAAAVLFERTSLRRDTAPRREKGKATARGTPLGLGPDGELARALNACKTAAGRMDVSVDTFVAQAMQPVGVPEVMSTLLSSTAGVSRPGNAATEHETYIPMAPIPYDLHQVTAPVNRQSRSPGDPCHTLAKQNAHNAGIVAFNARQDPDTWTERTGPLDTDGSTQAVAQPMPINTMVALHHNALGEGTGFGIGEPGDPAYTLIKGHSHAVAQPIPIDTMNMTPGHASGGLGFGQPGDPSFTLTKGHSHAVAQPIGGVDYENNAHLMDEPTGPLLKGSPTGGGRPLPALVYPMAVRRLTPVECERLQGFPDNYTNIPWRKQPTAPDGPRYKALGNSMAVPVMRWIGERINDQR